jgi:hypothetical protein
MSDTEDIIGIIILTLACAAIYCIGGYAWQTVQCKARWSDSNINAEYHVFGGCKVENSKGQLIPEKSYRNID